MLPRVTATRFVTALREGGSLPGLIEADDGGLWVVKFRGAGQGLGALVAEVIAGRLALAAGLPMPDLAILTVPPRFGATEGDPEVHELLAASVGDNLAMRLVPTAVGYDPAAGRAVDAGLAARVVAFDVLVSNIDRTYRNPNLVWGGDQLWLIDHGAALYWLHHWNGGTAGAAAPLPRLTEHALLPSASRLAEAATDVAARLDDDALTAAVAAVPDDWLGAEPDDRRRAIVARLAARRGHLTALVEVDRG